MTSYVDFQRNATHWNRVFLYRGAFVSAVVPIVCCKMDVPEAYSNNEPVEFIDIGQCMKHGDVTYINTKPCLGEVYIGSRCVCAGYNMYALMTLGDRITNINCS